MKDKEDDIEDLFRNRFDNEESPVSPIVWRNIQKTLPKESSFLDLNFFQSLLLWFLSSTLIISVLIAAITYQGILMTKKNTTVVFFLSDKNNTAIKHQVKNTDQTLNPSEHHAIVPFTEQTTSSISRDIDLHRKIIMGNKSSDEKTSVLTDRMSSEPYNAKSISRKTNVDLSLTKNKRSNPTKENRLKTKKTYNTSLTSSFYIAEKKSPAWIKNNASETKHVPISDKNLQEVIHTPIVHNTSSELTKKSDSLHLQLSNESKRSTDSLSVNDFKNHSESLGIATDTLLTNSVTINNTVLTENKSEELNIKKDSSQSIIADTSVVGLAVVDSIKNTTTADSTGLTKGIKENAHLRSYRKEAKELSGTVNEIFSKTQYESANTRRKKSRVTDDSIAINNNALITSPRLNTEIKKDSSLAKTDSTENVLPDSTLTKESSEKKKSEESDGKRWSVDLLGSGVLTGSTIKARDTNYQAAVRDKKDRSKNLPGYTFGVMINYKLNNTFRLSVGVSYTAFSEQYHFNYTLKRTAWMYVDTTWQYVQVDSINTDKIVKDQYRFLSIPLQVSYTFFTKGKLSFSATAGIRSNILLKGVTYLANANGTDVIALNNGFRSLSFSYLAALEMQYQFKSRLALLAQPVFNYSANSVYNSSSPIQQKLYSIGLTIGLRIVF
ncbi:MAG: hypothetical protein JWO58_2906 [Chitinophagaceae bacterium]|nr:hypothetical protein [Chitinophagaceae bacterium]